MKTCFKCNKEKELSEFYAQPGMKDGHLGKCKECTKKDAINHRNANIERIRAYDRERAKLPHSRKGRRLYTKKYKKNHPTRYLATNMLNNAVRDGKIKKPDTCSVCGDKCRIYGHHEDYYKPLEVIWVCQVCHKRVYHSKEK